MLTRVCLFISSKKKGGSLLCMVVVCNNRCLYMKTKCVVIMFSYGGLEIAEMLL